ncbi:MAG: AAA family ATPase [Clostridia bacterium]|nr:AAA family ATPase [Clostridia bacterium]
MQDRKGDGVAARKIPVGIQSFEKIRTDGFLYVDKTEYVYHLVHHNASCFLSRPRRFGKSLLLSTLKAYWEGRKELFSGLAIEKLEEDKCNAWKAYPVFSFDFNGENYQEKGALERRLTFLLEKWEKAYALDGAQSSLGARFRNLLIRAGDTTGLPCVILVDEYDKPLLEDMDHREMQEHNRDVLSDFFGVLKSCSDSIRFSFVTGVSRCNDLDLPGDISLDEEYACVCGLTDAEIRTVFGEEIDALCNRQHLGREEGLEKMKKWYDGYHFAPCSQSVYNPFSVLKCFFSKSFGSYWFGTGTPDLLIRKLRETDFDVQRLTEGTLYADERTLKSTTCDAADPVPLLYQTGYLTIAGYDHDRDRYALGFPCEEVKYAFLESLLSAYTPNANAANGLDIFTLDEHMGRGNLEGIRDVLTGMVACIVPGGIPLDHCMRMVIFLVFTLLGRFLECELHTFSGYIGCKVKTREYAYVFGFRMDGTAEEAPEKIEEKQSVLPFRVDTRKLYRIGVAFDSKSRMLTEWEVEE